MRRSRRSLSIAEKAALTLNNVGRALMLVAIIPSGVVLIFGICLAVMTIADGGPALIDDLVAGTVGFMLILLPHAVLFTAGMLIQKRRRAGLIIWWIFSPLILVAFPIGTALAVYVVISLCKPGIKEAMGSSSRSRGRRHRRHSDRTGTATSGDAASELRSRRRRKQAVAAIVSVAIVAVVLVMISLPRGWAFLQAARKRSQTKRAINAVVQACFSHALAEDDLPSSLEDLLTYRDVLYTTDEWGRPIVVTASTNVSNAVIVCSYGEDGTPGGVGSSADCRYAVRFTLSDGRANMIRCLRLQPR